MRAFEGAVYFTDIKSSRTLHRSLTSLRSQPLTGRSSSSNKTRRQDAPKDDMDSTFKSFAALFLLVAAASCAPTGHIPRDACGDVRSSSQLLNRVARMVSKEVRVFLFLFLSLFHYFASSMQIHIAKHW